MFTTDVHSCRLCPVFVTVVSAWHVPQAFWTVSLAAPSGSCGGVWAQPGRTHPKRRPMANSSGSDVLRFGFFTCSRELAFLGRACGLAELALSMGTSNRLI